VSYREGGIWSITQNCARGPRREYPGKGPREVNTEACQEGSEEEDDWECDLMLAGFQVGLIRLE
jgi:hypothetical protein